MSAASEPRRAEILVIGYGSTLHGDDAVGQEAASAVAGWDHPQIKAIAVHQLTPELAHALALVDIALFIDARLAREGEAIQAIPIEAWGSDTGQLVWHSSSPESLLRLAGLAYGASPRSWLVTIPAVDVNLGTNLSPTTQAGLEAALAWILDFVNQHERSRSPECMKSH